MESAGGELILVGVQGPLGALALTLGGVLSLDNEDDFAVVPYQMLRAALSFNGRIATGTNQLDRDHRYRVSAELGYTHESDHASGFSNVSQHLQRYVALDDFSSYEHLRLGVQYEHWYRNWLWLSADVAIRAYTPPINPRGGREQRFAFETELRARLLIDGALSAYVAFYTEGVTHELNPAVVGLGVLPTLFTSTRAELGLRLSNEVTGRLDLYLGVTEEWGRGIDFIMHYGLSPLAGLRGTL